MWKIQANYLKGDRYKLLIRSKANETRKFESHFKPTWLRNIFRQNRQKKPEKARQLQTFQNDWEQCSCKWTFLKFSRAFLEYYLIFLLDFQGFNCKHSSLDHRRRFKVFFWAGWWCLSNISLFRAAIYSHWSGRTRWSRNGAASWSTRCWKRKIEYQIMHTWEPQK